MPDYYLAPLIDRLCDDRRLRSGDSGPGTVIDPDQYRARVMRELDELLNATPALPRLLARDLDKEGTEASPHGFSGFVRVPNSILN